MPRINLKRISYVVYQHTDLPTFEKFSDDFGFKRIPATYSFDDASDNSILFEGYGPDAYVYVAQPAPSSTEKEHKERFIGAGFIARSATDFENAQKLPEAELTDISHLPGGGQRVSITDPNGYLIQIIHGQTDKSVPSSGISNVYEGSPNVNSALTKRRKGIFNRMTEGPSMVNKLGHFGYQTDNYRSTSEWYSTNFNFKATDIVHVPGNPSAEFITFFHLDLGSEYSDHHSLLVAQRETGKGTDVHHASFEVEDLDTEMMGHKWLESKGYESVWGVGRHIMGSQVFDYWRDTSGFIIEHYADGDVVNEDYETSRVGGLAAAVWGPPMPAVWH